MKFLKIIENDWNEPGQTFIICDTGHEVKSQRKRQKKKINNIKF
jgi:hypothetical protein